jgi:2-oxoglutarate/2-oxoacid ferredoxin oxidoreductase subunit beta
VFGQNSDKGIRLEGFKPVVVQLGDGISAEDLWIHDETDRVKANILIRFFSKHTPGTEHFPRPFGVFYTESRTCYEDALNAQVLEATSKKGAGNLNDLLRGREVWQIG